MLVTLVCISKICINLTRDLLLVSRGKKDWQSLYMEGQSFHLIWNWQNYTQVFLQIHVFWGWVKVSPKTSETVFLRKHRFVEKKNVLFCRLSLYISLKQIWMNGQYFELTWLYAFSCQFYALLTEVMPERLH